MGFTKAAVALQLLLSTVCTALPTSAVGVENIARQVADSATVYDAIIVGGGPAGLSALSGLARVRRNVLLIDSGEYRNDPTRHMHDVIGTDGVSPAFFRWKARNQLAYYQTVSLINGTVTEIEVPENNGTAVSETPFTVHTTFASGEKATVGARGIILATGVTDIIPGTPGVLEAWGKGIFWCPWCDGNEHADQPLGILSNLNEAASQVQEISSLNDNIIAFVNGTNTPEMRAEADKKFPGWETYLASRNIRIENRTISGLVRLADGGENEHPEAPTFPEHDLFQVDFTEGPSVQRAAFFASFPNKLHSTVGADMGVRLDGGRLAADPTRGLMTNIPGVYAIGDANADNVTNVPHAMFSGKRAAVFLHVAIARKETAAIIAQNSTLTERSFELDPRAVWETMNGGEGDILDAGDYE